MFNSSPELSQTTQVSAETLETLRAISWNFKNDAALSARSMAKPKCKDPTWHALRVDVFTRNAEAIDEAMAALSKAPQS